MIYRQQPWPIKLPITKENTCKLIQHFGTREKYCRKHNAFLTINFNISKNANNFLSARVRSIKPSLLVSLVTRPGNYWSRVRLKYGQWLHFYTFSHVLFPGFAVLNQLGPRRRRKLIKPNNGSFSKSINYNAQTEE